MKGWYSKFLGDAIVARTELARIDAIFEDEYRKAGQPPEMAVFTQYDAQGGLHCKVTAFFSPAAADIARCVKASPSLRPLSHRVELFAGKEESWAVLFPEG